jgi:hypothetical protein
MSSAAVLPSQGISPATRTCEHPPPRSRLRRAAYFSACLAVALLAAEFGARLDDWVHDDVPLLANPTPEHDLQVQDSGGIVRGRPFGKYKRWKLNEHGFRSPPMSKEPAAGRCRVAVLGASETFGLFESNGEEMPAQLAREFRDEEQPVDVFNASITGMTARTMLPYWEAWLNEFRPGIVVLYASPLFYLREWAAGPRSTDASSRQSGGALRPLCPQPAFASRFVARAKDVVHWPDFIQRYRNQCAIEDQAQGRPAGWHYRSVPAANLARFRADIVELTGAIRACGAEVVIVTHAVRAASPPRPADAHDLDSMRVHLPQATPEVLVAFNQSASSVLLDLCRAKRIPTVDAAAALNGQRELFGDLVHFTDGGASSLARLVAARLRPLVREIRSSPR